MLKSILAEDVQWDIWEANSAQAAGVPWLVPRQGPTGVREFFSVLARLSFRHFAVKSLMGGEAGVAAEIELEVETEQGAVLRDEEVHVWHFNPQGQVQRFRHYIDTTKHIAGARQQTTPELQTT